MGRFYLGDPFGDMLVSILRLLELFLSLGVNYNLMDRLGETLPTLICSEHILSPSNSERANYGIGDFFDSSCLVS